MSEATTTQADVSPVAITPTPSSLVHLSADVLARALRAALCTTTLDTRPFPVVLRMQEHILHLVATDGCVLVRIELPAEYVATGSGDERIHLARAMVHALLGLLAVDDEEKEDADDLDDGVLGYDMSLRVEDTEWSRVYIDFGKREITCDDGRLVFLDEPSRERFEADPDKVLREWKGGHGWPAVSSAYVKIVAETFQAFGGHRHMHLVIEPGPDALSPIRITSPGTAAEMLCMPRKPQGDEVGAS